MLAIRLQRTGRKGRAHYRVVVQDARKSPKSGKVVASLGSFNPHDKTFVVDKEKAGFYLKNGAQPSPRVSRLLADDGVKLPDWVSVTQIKQRSIRNAEKLRRNRPAEEASEEAPAEDTASEKPSEEVEAGEPQEETVGEDQAGEKQSEEETPAETSDTKEAEETPATAEDEEEVKA